jgi:hypothetical protein
MMSATLDVLADHGNEITGLVSISAKMQLVADEATVNYMLANRIKAYREQAHNSRQQINIAASTCNDDYFVNEKAGEALQMVSEFDEVMDSLQNKLGGTGQ